MFKIDFLKGQGLPTKSRPLDIAMLTTVVMFAAMVFALLGIQYFAYKSELVYKQKELTRAQGLVKLDKTAGKYEKRLTVYEQCRAEVADSIGRYVQWTPVLREFSMTLPPTMLLNELRATRTVSKEKVTSKKDPKKKVDVEIFTRRFQADLYDFMPDEDGAILRSYLADCRNSDALNDILEGVYLSESSDDEYEDSTGDKRNVKKHIVNCTLRSRQKVGEK